MRAPTPPTYPYVIHQMRAALWTLGRWPRAGDAAKFALQRTPLRAHAVAASVSHSLVACDDNVLAVGQAAAVIRKLRPPEPYKGKGVRYAGETVRRKEGKKK
mgnify:CR=1 FL=1